jgi:teichuronic acid biosynthesis glycosyltransferase TuaG
MSSQRPLISVIMPVFNAEKYVGEAINSVLSQEYHQIELIVVDDGSTDKSMDIITSFSDKRISLYKQENSGVASARNAGLMEMKGDYFCFLDADDIMTKVALISRLKEFELAPDLAFVGGGQVQKNSDLSQILKTQLPTYYGPPRKGLVMLDDRCFINCGTWLIKRDKQRKYMFPLGWTHSEDLAFFLSISDQGSLGRTNEVAQVYRRHEDSAMGNLQSLEKSYWNYYDFVKNGRYHRSKTELMILQLKIRKIMFLSYLARKDIIRAIFSLIRKF